MAPDNKLLLRNRHGDAVVACVARACGESRTEGIVVVTGHQAALVEQAVRATSIGLPVTFAHCHDHEAGLSASLRAGIAAMSDTTAAALVCLGDMPLVTGALLDRIVDAYDPGQGRTIIQPTCRGEAGNPVLWDRRFFGEIRALSGDAGARTLLARHAEQVFRLELGDRAVLVDFDTPLDWEGRSTF